LKYFCLPLLLVLWIAGSLHVAAAAQPAYHPAPDARRTFVPESVLMERDFPLLSALLADSKTRSLLAQDAVLSRITKARWESVRAADRDCSAGVSCEAELLRFSAAQVDEIRESLLRLYRANPNLRAFVHTRLRPASMYRLVPSQAESDLLVDGWTRSAAAMNQIIAVYCEGARTRYPKIDAMLYDPGSEAFAAIVHTVVADLGIEESAASTDGGALFFEPTLRFSLRLLQLNSRDEAGRFWPLDSGENAASLERTRSIEWSKYAYSVILVPGEGPEMPNVPLSPIGRERVRLAVDAYRSGVAPFILLSGGFVHPAQTPFCEAAEMKRYLMEVYRIPASAILLEPYARHTTTNLRNAVRLVFAYGLPSGLPMLVVSDPAQIDYIQSVEYSRRNQEELGYLPATIGRRRSESSIEALPSSQSLYRDATDPLDP